MIKTILIPTDFSNCARQAELVAEEIAFRKKASITFIHGMSVGFPWDRLTVEQQNRYPEVAKSRNDAEKILNEKMAEAANRGISAQQSIIHIEGQKSMANHLPVDDYDLIVMGGVGDNNPSKPVIGANTAKVLRTSKTPVLVVKKDVSLPVAFDTIVFASGLEPDTHKAFAQLLSFAETMGASNLHLVEVTTPNNFKPTFFVREKMEAFISKHRVKNIQIHNYNHYTIEAGVFEFAKRVNASLLAIANHGRNDITSLFIESVPENLVKFSDVPVLSIMV